MYSYNETPRHATVQERQTINRARLLQLIKSMVFGKIPSTSVISNVAIGINDCPLVTLQSAGLKQIICRFLSESVCILAHLVMLQVCNVHLGCMLSPVFPADCQQRLLVKPAGTMKTVYSLKYDERGQTGFSEQLLHICMLSLQDMNK